MKTTTTCMHYAQKYVLHPIVLYVMMLSTGHNIFAQQGINTSFKTLMDNTFQPLEKNRVPHGILLDFGMEFIHVPAYNGTLTDTSHINKRVLKEIYNTLLMSRITTTSTGFVTPEDFNTNWKNNRSKNYIALSGLYFKYSRFQENAYPSKLNYINNKFDDKYVGSVWQNPYETLQTFALTTPIEVYDGLSLKVKVPQNIFYSNASSSINGLEIDFADGNGYRQVSFNQEVPVNYTTTGNKTWKYKLALTNGQSLYAQSKIKITGDAAYTGQIFAKTASAKGVANWVCDNSGRYQLEAEAEIAHLGVFGTATITLDDAGNDCQITRPLIVAEGFDVGALLNPETPLGSSDIESFFEEINDSQSNNLRNLIIGNFFTPNDQDYDIIYIDWDNGVDYLQRNAYILEEVINWVNATKVADATGVVQQNVVLGQSMGGVVARYALSDMETRGDTHDTRLFISQDAPQQGANVPLSCQFMYRHLVRQYVTTSNTLLGGIVTIPLANSLADTDIANYTSLLDMPASRQLLKNWSTTSYTLDNNWHDDFYNELRTLNSNGGYPQQGGIRNIAISNGSECGTPQTYGAGDHLINVQMNEKLSFLENLAFYFLSPLIGTVGGLTIDPDFLRVGLLARVPGSSRFIIDVQAKALSYTSNAHIYKGLIRYKKKILLVFNSQVSITNVNKNQPSGILPFDYYGGGFFDTSGYNDIIDVGIGDITVEVEDKFSFIPTASALDIKQNSSNLNDADYLESYAGGQPTPTTSFDNFATAFTAPNDVNNNNEQHLEFNLRNGDWLAAELIGTNIQFTNCSYICEDVSISGRDKVCSRATYSVSSGGTFYNWSIIEGNGIASLSGTGTSVTLNRNGSSSGYVTIRVEYGDNGVQCGNTIITKRVFVGTPTVDYAIFENGIGEEGYFCTSHTNNTFEILPRVSGANYQYRLLQYPNLNVVYTSSVISGNTGTIYYTPSPGWYAFEARIIDSCGTSDWGGGEVEYVDCSNGGGGGEEGEYRFAVYPNPSSSEINITQKNMSNNTLFAKNIQKETVISLKLYDFSRHVLKESTGKSLKSINVSQIKEGIYYLEITTNKTVEMHKIVVDR